MHTKTTTYDFLAEADTETLFYILGEILDPAHLGPLGKGYKDDARYDAFMSAIYPLHSAWHKHQKDIVAAVEV